MEILPLPRCEKFFMEHVVAIHLIGLGVIASGKDWQVRISLGLAAIGKKLVLPLGQRHHRQAPFAHQRRTCKKFVGFGLA